MPGTPRPVADGIWIVEGDPLPIAGLHLPVRMTIVALPDGALLLHSPVARQPALAEALGRLGRVGHLVAPNIAHWTMIGGWQRAEPAATLWAVPNLRKRGQVRRSGLRIDRDLTETPPPEWGGVFEQAMIPGAAGFQELALLHRPSRTLILTDVVQNMGREVTPAWARPAAWLLGAAQHDGRPPVYLRLAVKGGGEPARAAARRLVGWAPERVIFSHGDWYERDGTASLRRALDWLL